MNRIAIIDLGSNSIRFIIISVSAKGIYQLIYQEKRSIRLAEGMSDDSPFLTDAAQNRAIDCLKVYAHLAKVHQVTKTLAVATAAVRTARNGSSFLKRVHSAANIPMTIISGKQEAALGFSGVIHTIDTSEFLLFDLGGASIEISLVKNKKQLHSVSIPIGAVSLTEKFKSSGLLSAAEIKHIRSYIKSKLQSIPWLPKSPIPVIGIGGTIRNLAKIHQRYSGYPLSKLHNYKVSSQGLLSVIHMILKSSPEERRKIPGLSAERGDIINAGALIVREILTLTKAESLTISGCGLREGLFYHWYDPIYDKNKELQHNMLLSSVRNYYSTLPLKDHDHTRYVTALALSMFDQWRKIYQMPDRMRTLLHMAGLLHDAGQVINYYSHARHSAYMTANAHIFGWSHKEQVLCALITAFHHGFSGKILKSIKETQILTEKEIDRVKILSAFLALAESLDENHEQCISQVICTSTPSSLNIHIYLNRDNFIVPAHATKKIISAYEKLCHYPLIIQWFPSSRQKDLIKEMARSL